MKEGISRRTVREIGSYVNSRHSTFLEPSTDIAFCKDVVSDCLVVCSIALRPSWLNASLDLQSGTLRFGEMAILNKGHPPMA